MHRSSSPFLVIHGGYTQVAVGLATAHNRDDNSLSLDTATMPHRMASRDILPIIDMLFTRNNVNLQDCVFLAAHQGPGPFTTLRSVLATINGLAFATTLPLVGVDGLDAFLEEERGNHKTRYLSCILNAYCDDVYFALYDQQTHSLIKGCESIELYIARLKDLQDPLTLIGNGVALHEILLRQELTEKLNKEQVVIPAHIPDLATIEAIAKNALSHWKNGTFSTELLPLYLKDSGARLTTLIK